MTTARSRPGSRWRTRHHRAYTPRSAARIATLGAIILACLGLLLIRLWFLQVISGERYAQHADANRLRTVRQEAPRGAIVDRNGRPLVTNRTALSVVARADGFAGERGQAVLRRVARVLEVPPREVIDEIDAAAGSPLETVTLADDVGAPVERYLAERKRDFPGIGLKQTYRRRYTADNSLAHVLGYTGKVTAETLKAYRAKGYTGDETVGASGLEAQYEAYLRGDFGRATYEVDSTGEPRSRRAISSVAPRQGSTLELSIDLPTQAALARSLEQQVAQAGGRAGAAGVALDPATGEVLAIASYPTYRPDVFSRGRPRQVRRLLKDPRRPLLDRAIAGLYPAGSTFKVVTAAAALRRGFLQPFETLSSPGELRLYGQTFRGFESRTWGQVDLRRALEVSSDTFFYQLGDLFYRDGSRTALQDEAHRFGLGQATGIDLPGGGDDGLVPDEAWKRRAFRSSPDPLDRSWKPGDSINLSTGQGNLLVTPLQMARAYAAIANGGQLVTPTIARRVLDPSGRTLRALRRSGARPSLGLSAQTLAALRDGLTEAANGHDGTSAAVFGGLPASARVAGKTGTAENETGVDHSWYVGYAPVPSPRIVTAVVIEQGGQGANAAAPAVCQTITAYLEISARDCGGGASAN